MPAEEKRRLIVSLERCPFYQYEADNRCYGKADADIDADGLNGTTRDADGRPMFAYAPNDAGLDLLKNAGYPGGSYRDILVCGENHEPIPFRVDGAVGYYSKTAYFWRNRSWDDPLRYLDSMAVPYIVVEDFIRKRAKGIVLGCKARLTNTVTKKTCDAVVGDIGPLYKIGEISMAAAKAIGINPNPKIGGESRRIIEYEFWPGVPAELNGTKYDLIPRGG